MGLEQDARAIETMEDIKEFLIQIAVVIENNETDIHNMEDK